MSIKIGMPWKPTFPRIRVSVPDPFSGAWVSGIGDSTVSEDGRTLISGHNPYTSYQPYWNTMVTSGKIYIEVKIKYVESTSGYNPACGWINSTNIKGGLFADGSVNSVFYWSGFADHQTSGSSTSKAVTPALGSSHDGMIIMFARDVEANKFWIGMDGNWYNGATVSDIEAGLNPTFVQTGTMPYFITSDANNGKASCSFEMNQGQKPYAYQKPEGFTPMGHSLRA